MKKLSDQHYHSVQHLFHYNYPNLPMIFAILENRIPGEVWVDQEKEPSLVLVMTGAPYCFMRGEMNEDRFKECFKLLKHKPLVKLALEPNPHFDISKFGFSPVLRRQYRYKNTNNLIPHFDNNTDYLIKKIEDINIFNVCLWKSLMTELFGSGENFLKNGIGFILWDSKNNIIASESYGIPSREFVEVGTITHENYRRQNLSTILCNYLVKYSIHKGLKPVWSCNEENFISWKVAEKLCMDELITYTFHTWSK